MSLLTSKMSLLVSQNTHFDANEQQVKFLRFWAFGGRGVATLTVRICTERRFSDLLEAMPGIAQLIWELMEV